MLRFHLPGDIKRVELFKDKRSQPAGCALVEFETCNQAVLAEQMMSGKKLLRMTLVLFFFSVFLSS
jgi:hypothetical protein